MPAVAPVDPERLAALLGPGTWWTRLESVEVTGSTNDDVVARAEAGEPAGLARFAAHQTGGRGRHARTWVDVPGACLAVSVLVRPARPRPTWGWVPLLAGAGLAGALTSLWPHAAGRIALKWPNDVLVDGAKVSGILAQATADAVVIGVGVNVALEAGELPLPTATSLRLAFMTEHRPDVPVSGTAGGPGPEDSSGGRETDMTKLAAAVLSHLQERLAAWEAGEDVRTGYEASCATIGRPVRVLVGPDQAVEGVATGVDDGGSLVVATREGERVFSAGDVVHLR
ncbi:MAG: biotin--[acetyl-CoA-carboxylase] ligase [Actinomycetia bacterium]|nr:biotin--[acetyl-CoA-carboxylase] ligase [Actinomycetes bacterium]